MTKYEWESELKRNIHRLPKSEQDRALEFYNELFEDRIESGWTETQIIAEFGNPCDVADKILAEYDESAADSGDDASATRLSSVNTPYGPGDARRPDNAADAPAAEDCGQTPAHGGRTRKRAAENFGTGLFRPVTRRCGAAGQSGFPHSGVCHPLGAVGRGRACDRRRRFASARRRGGGRARAVLYRHERRGGGPAISAWD